MVEVAVSELSVEVVETSSRSRRPRVAERSREVEVVVGESYAAVNQVRSRVVGHRSFQVVAVHLAMRLDVRVEMLVFWSYIYLESCRSTGLPHRTCRVAVPSRLGTGSTHRIA